MKSKNYNKDINTYLLLRLEIIIYIFALRAYIVYHMYKLYRIIFL